MSTKPTSKPKTEQIIVMEERLRIDAILNSAVGKARPETARKLALHSSLSADMAADLLKTMPIESPYLAALDREGPVAITAGFADAANISASDPKAARLAEIAEGAAAFNLSRGFTPKAKG